ncbi:uncharacterized protein LOC141851879 [Brevipalpus obovatus]|uniref:uncharacterized protein LOC141851879 n=1 Tax=Brevipalpus obovatus TaxID=246614 RepID=UPI003D9E8689
MCCASVNPWPFRAKTFHFSVVIFFSILYTIIGYKISIDKNIVMAGNFSYYFIESDPPIRIILISLKGDCDLYIAHGTSKPTTDLDTYQLHSATCGFDTVDIEQNSGSKHTIGIYGHPVHEYSVYQLEVISYSPEEDISSVEHGSVDLNDEKLLRKKSQAIENSLLFNDESEDSSKFSLIMKSFKTGLTSGFLEFIGELTIQGIEVLF